MSPKLLFALLLTAAPAAAQSTGTPVFHAPYRPYERHEYGGSISDRGNIAVEGFVGFGKKGQLWDVSVRAGVADGGGGHAVFLVGADVRYRLITQTADFPLDGSFLTGFGANLVSGSSSFGIPIGLSVGRRVSFKDSNLSLVPYAEPLIFPHFGSGASAVGVALGLGADLRINQRFEIRAGVGIGDVETLSISVAVVR